MPRLQWVSHTKKRNIWLLSLCVPWWKQRWTVIGLSWNGPHEIIFFQSGVPSILSIPLCHDHGPGKRSSLFLRFYSASWCICITSISTGPNLDLTALQSGVNMSLSTKARPEPNDKRFDLRKHSINAWNILKLPTDLKWHYLVAVATTDTNCFTSAMPCSIISIPALKTQLHTSFQIFRLKASQVNLVSSAVTLSWKRRQHIDASCKQAL